jgi:hypothetical protein
VAVVAVVVEEDEAVVAIREVFVLGNEKKTL